MDGWLRDTGRMTSSNIYFQLFFNEINLKLLGVFYGTKPLNFVAKFMHILFSVIPENIHSSLSIHSLLLSVQLLPVGKNLNLSTMCRCYQDKSLIIIFLVTSIHRRMPRLLPPWSWVRWGSWMINTKQSPKILIMMSRYISCFASG